MNKLHQASLDLSTNRTKQTVQTRQQGTFEKRYTEEISGHDLLYTTSPIIDLSKIIYDPEAPRGSFVNIIV